jgi:hypothetical protein
LTGLSTDLGVTLCVGSSSDARHFSVGNKRRAILEDDAIVLHFDLRFWIPLVGRFEGVLELVPEVIKLLDIAPEQCVKHLRVKNDGAFKGSPHETEYKVR